MKVKICGITNLKDAKAAVHAGADALGFIFTQSPRQVTPQVAQEIVGGIGPFTTKVGVFVNQEIQTVLDIARTCRLDALQLHGEESIDYCRKLAPYQIIKTFRVGELFSMAQLKGYMVDSVLFESDSDTRGGSGRTWAWERLPKAKIKSPLIVSGGLNPNNVATAIKILRPYAVDVSSGVESKPGQKSRSLMEKFIANAKQA